MGGAAGTDWGFPPFPPTPGTHRLLRKAKLQPPTLLLKITAAKAFCCLQHPLSERSAGLGHGAEGILILRCTFSLREGAVGCGLWESLGVLGQPAAARRKSPRSLFSWLCLQFHAGATQEFFLTVICISSSLGFGQPWARFDGLVKM